eukprot:3874272-Prymnesium_polylepis.1
MTRGRFTTIHNQFTRGACTPAASSGVPPAVPPFAVRAPRDALPAHLPRHHSLALVARLHPLEFPRHRLRRHSRQRSARVLAAVPGRHHSTSRPSLSAAGTQALRCARWPGDRLVGA